MDSPKRRGFGSRRNSHRRWFLSLRLEQQLRRMLQPSRNLLLVVFSVLVVATILTFASSPSPGRESFVAAGPESTSNAAENQLGEGKKSVKSAIADTDLNDVRVRSEMKAANGRHPAENHDMLLRHPRNGQKLSELTASARKGSNGVVVGGSEIPSGEHVLVHLDLKGAPPRMSYLKSLLPFIKELGATGVLIEYEDTFPYSDGLQTYSSLSEKYSAEQMSQLLSAAKSLNLITIPLVQTFGHMEWILKHSEMGHLREDPRSPKDLCPSRDEGRELVKAIIDQVMAIHNESNWLHIGGDEVRVLGKCDRCRSTMGQHGWTKHELFLDHMVAIADYVKKKYDVQPIMWDDMLRKIPREVLKASELGNLVEPMVWGYTPPYTAWIPHAFKLYEGIFKYVWAASAFKGADGPDAIFPHYSERIKNNLEWVKLMRTAESTTSLSFRGIALTGWQRYTHFSILCELLPTSLPVLGTILQVVKGSSVDSPSVTSYLSDLYKCPGLFETLTSHTAPNSKEHPAAFVFRSPECNFHGAAIFSLMLELRSAKHRLDKLEDHQWTREYWNEYNARHGFGSAFDLDQLMRQLEDVLSTLEAVAGHAEGVLLTVFGGDTVQEVLESLVRPQLRRARRWVGLGRSLTSNQTLVAGQFLGWKSRPIHRSGPSVGHLADDL